MESHLRFFSAVNVHTLFTPHITCTKRLDKLEDSRNVTNLLLDLKWLQ